MNINNIENEDVEPIVLEPGDIVTVLRQKLVRPKTGATIINAQTFTAERQEPFLVIRTTCPHCIVEAHPELPEEFRSMEFVHENAWEGLKNEKIISLTWPKHTGMLLSNYTIDIFSPKSGKTTTYYGLRNRDNMTSIPIDWRMDTEDMYTGNYYSATEVNEMLEAKKKAPYMALVERMYKTKLENL